MGLAIPTKLDSKLVETLDRLVSEGFYVSRSEAIREAVRKLVAEQYISLASFLRMIAEIASEALIYNLSDVITDIVLFGSVARGKVTPESDIDLLVLTKNENYFEVRRKSHEILYPISLVSATPITSIVMSQSKFVKLVRNNFSFAREIRENGVQLYGEVLKSVRN